MPNAPKSSKKGITNASVEDEMELDKDEDAVGREQHSGTVGVMELDRPKEALDENVPSKTSQPSDIAAHQTSESVASSTFTTRPSDLNRTTTVTQMSSAAPSPKAPFVRKTSLTAAETGIGDNESILGADDHSFDGTDSSSSGSSPAKGLLRKSSLTFAALPAREPIPTKKSIGNIGSRTSTAELSRPTGFSRSSYLDRGTGGKSLGMYRPAEDEKMEDRGERVVEAEKDESDADEKITKLHNKSSTQRLHERINMLGKAPAPRPTKSIPAVPAASQLSYPELPKDEIDSNEHQDEKTADTKFQSNQQSVEDNEDNDWIKPLPVEPKHATRPELCKSRSVDVMEQIAGKNSVSQNDVGQVNTDQAFGYTKTIESHQSALQQATDNAFSPSSLESPRLHKKAISVSNPSVPVVRSTTPAASPTTKNLDGHISASKSKLQSIMKSARGLFSSSARISTQAKLETMSPSARSRQIPTASIDEVAEPTKTTWTDDATRPSVPPKESPRKEVVDEPRRLRISTEKQQRAVQEQRKGGTAKALEDEAASNNDDIYKQVEPNHDIAFAASKGKIPQQPTRPTRQSPRRPPNQGAPLVAESMTSQSTVHGHPTMVNGASQQSKDVRRPTKPTKEMAPKSKPQPVSIRVGTLSQRVPLTNAVISSGLHDSLAPASSAPGPAKPTAPVKKASNPTLHQSASATSLNRSVSSATAKPRALLAAERKKEQDEREAQRKLEQKKEIERKRAAAQEEARKREVQRQEDERQKQKERTAAAAADDEKRKAQKAAIEKRRLELSTKEQRQRDPHRAINEVVSGAETRHLPLAHSFRVSLFTMRLKAPPIATDQNWDRELSGPRRWIDQQWASRRPV